MDSDVLWLSVEDIPTEIYGDKLLFWLQSKYPNKRVLIQGYLSIFLQLPIELLTLILKINDSVWLMSIRFCKNLRTLLLKPFYSTAYDKPISKWEIAREIDSAGSVTFLENINYDGENDIIRIYELSSYLNFEDNPDDQYYVFSNWRFDNEGDVMCLRSPDDCDEAGFQDMKNFRDIRTIKDVGTTLEMFSEYKLLSKRLGFISYDSNYANKRLIERYNREIAPNLNTIISVEDAKRTLIT